MDMLAYLMPEAIHIHKFVDGPTYPYKEFKE